MLDVSSSKFEDGKVELTVTLPKNLVKSFVQLMGSLHGFFQQVSYKTRLAEDKARAQAPEEVFKREKARDDFTAEVLKVFDGLVSEGMEIRAAVSETNRRLKVLGRNFASHYIVNMLLSQNGRLRKNKHLKKSGRP